MNAIHRLFSFVLCATTAMLLLLANVYAQSKDTNTCAMLAGSFTPNISMQIKAADQSHQMIQREIYAACLQTRGKQGASRTTAPGQAGTNAANAGDLVTFDPPGSTSTIPTAINPAGTVTGSFIDAGALVHSFLRTSGGTITQFDPPGATCSVSTQTECSAAVGITPDGTIVGGYAAGLLFRGYLRAPSGAFTLFDPPGSQSTFPSAINPAWTVTGGFADSAGRGHGFLRAPNGTFTTFDPLGSTSTGATAINPAGTVTGVFIDVRGVFHGFLRTSDGTITAFDASADSQITFANAINPAGTTVGEFFTTAGFEHGFLRAPNGAITVFDAPGSLFTFPTGINPAGTVTGNFFPPEFFPDHGFVGRPKNMR